jgi:hypothetical protein
MREMIQTSIRIRPQTWKRLKEKVGDGNRSAAVRRLIRSYVGMDDPPDDSSDDPRASQPGDDDAGVGTAAPGRDRDAPTVDDLRRMDAPASGGGDRGGDESGRDVDSEERADGDDPKPWYEREIF